VTCGGWEILVRLDLTMPANLPQVEALLLGMGMLLSMQYLVNASAQQDLVNASAQHDVVEQRCLNLLVWNRLCSSDCVSTKELVYHVCL